MGCSDDDRAARVCFATSWRTLISYERFPTPLPALPLKLVFVIERSHDQLTARRRLDAFPWEIAEPTRSDTSLCRGSDLELVRQQRGGRFRCRGCNGALTE